MFLTKLQLKNGPTAAIWSCREDVVAILVGQAILLRPMFTTTFWTGKYTGKGGYSTKPSKHSANLERSFEMNKKNRKSTKSKNADPFSITAALATVMGTDESPPSGSPNGSTEQIIESSAGGHQVAVHKTNKHSEDSLVDMEKGPRHYKGREGIHVSKTVSVENTQQQQDPETWQRLYAPGNSLRFTNNARAWNETGY
jgi:hypothetical protein